MNEMSVTELIGYFTSIATAVGGWIIGRAKRKSDAIADLQSSIDLLSEKNAELLQKLLEANGRILELEGQVKELTEEIKRLREQK